MTSWLKTSKKKTILKSVDYSLHQKVYQVSRDFIGSFTVVSSMSTRFHLDTVDKSRHLIDRFLDVPGGVTATFRIISFKLCLNNLRILCYESLLDWPNRIESSMHILNHKTPHVTGIIIIIM